MFAVFNHVKEFNHDLSLWDVTDMFYMFASAEAFNQDLIKWDVSSVSDMFGMFCLCFLNGDISSCSVLLSPKCQGCLLGRMHRRDISVWDVSSTLCPEWMFRVTKNFSRNLSSWDVSSALDMSFMFSDFYNNVMNMTNMFIPRCLQLLDRICVLGGKD